MKYILMLLTLITLSSCESNLVVNIENKSALNRDNESVTIEWDEISAKLGDIKEAEIVVNNEDGEEIPSQILYEGGKNPIAILFQVNLTPNSSAKYFIKKGARSVYTTQTFGRFVPERKDDFAWENNRIAYRMYGPALEATKEISNGIDVWLKRTPEMIIDKWYVKGNDYHSDSGEGLDCYKVGRTLGAGANSPIIGDSLIMSNNYTEYKILDCGALRTKFELCYAPFLVDNIEVTQKRTITLDANDNLNTITTTYSGDFNELDVASGIVIHNEEGEKIDTTPKSIAYAQKDDPKNGTTYVLVVTKEDGASIKTKKHILKTTKVKNGQPYTYKSGGYWSKYGINNYAHWKQTIEQETDKFNNELIVTVI